jgi:alcohol dehydrogenase class IV
VTAAAPSPTAAARGTHDPLPPQRVRWGAGVLDELGGELVRLGARRALLLTTPPLEGAPTDAVERALGTALAGRSAELEAQVPRASVERVARAARELEVDALVAFGGGSVIDGAKAVRRQIAGEGGAPPVQVALPTTLSGAELSHFYGVTEDDFKRSYAEPDAVPAVVLLDPRLTAATPDRLWAGSGMKALDHAVEGMLGRGRRPICDPLALEGVRGLAQQLPAARAPDALEARLACQLAAWQGYFAPANATLGLSHRIGHILGGTYGVPHSLTSAITLPPVLRVQAQRDPQTVGLLAGALGADPAAPASAADALEALARELGLPTRLRDVEVGREEVPRIARLVAEHYPQEAAILGEDAEGALGGLLDAAH